MSGAVATSDLPAWIQALLVLIAGAFASGLLAALALMQGRSRERAYALVREKTTELRHQALHDALTGLPNRTLALDRAEQTLARARRRGVPAAALYVDIDGFKHINDTFGHAVGEWCCVRWQPGCAACCERATPRRVLAVTSSSC